MNKSTDNAETPESAGSKAIMSDRELAALGGGRVAYIKQLSSEEAVKLYPAASEIPPGVRLFALHAADGSPIALTDTRQAAVGHAMGDELEIASVH